MVRLGYRVAVVLACAVAIATSASAAVAGVGSIPRPPGAIDNRGYELVSQAEKDANQIRYASPPTDDGNRVLYDLFGGAPGSPGGQALFQANRTASGWVSKNILPPREQMLDNNYVTNVTSPDLTRLAASVFTSIGQRGEDPTEDLVRLDTGQVGDAVQQTELYHFPEYVGNIVNGISTVAASDDVRHVYASLATSTDPLLPPPVQIYDFGAGGTPAIVSLMPITNQPPACGSPNAGNNFASQFTQTSMHWTSADGSRVFFLSQGDDCTTPFNLFMRDRAANGGAGVTTLISSPAVGSDTENGIDQFLGATADGSQVFYRTATSLEPADDSDGNSNDMDIYRWTVATGNVCLTCTVPNANVSLPPAANIVNAIVSEDGSHVYFGSAEQFAGAPGPASDSAPNLYVWRRSDNSIHYVATTDGVTGLPSFGGELTPDGNTYVFRSANPTLNTIPGVGGSNVAAPGGSCGGSTCFEYYRYDDRTWSPTRPSVMCLSCPVGGAMHDATPALTSIIQLPHPRARAVSDDGSIIVVSGPDPLVPEDVNAQTDLYEWHNGAVKLITDGVTQRTVFTPPTVVSLTPDGHDVFFIDLASLTADARDGSFKIYDARVDGGFPPLVPMATCDGEPCRGLPSAAPALRHPNVEAGPGNVSPPPLGAFSVGRVSAGARGRFARSGRLTLSVRVNQPGRVSAVARATISRRVVVVASGARLAGRAGRVRVTLRLSGVARRVLARRGRLRVVVGVGFSRALGGKRLVLVLSSSGRGR
jgi:hypothetical protein